MIGELKFVPVYFPVPSLTATVQTEPRITVLLCILSEDVSEEIFLVLKGTHGT
jgi:hypothetical protein